MDDTTSATGLPLWRPQSRLGGSVEIVLNFYHPLTGRETFGSLSPTEYLEAWTERRLSFQRDETPKPDHLPTPEQVEEFLRHKGTSLSAEVAVSLRQRKLQAELRNAVANTISGTQTLAAPVRTDSSVEKESEDEVLNFAINFTNFEEHDFSSFLVLVVGHDSDWLDRIGRLTNARIV